MVIAGVFFLLGSAGLFAAGRWVSSSYWGRTGKVRAYVGSVCFLIVGILFLTVWR